MKFGIFLLMVAVLFFLAMLPIWPHSRRWGYEPSGAVGIALVVLLMLLATGRL